VKDALLGADRAVAFPHGRLLQVDADAKPHPAAMAAALVCLQHFPAPLRASDLPGKTIIFGKPSAPAILMTRAARPLQPRGRGARGLPAPLNLRRGRRAARRHRARRHRGSGRSLLVRPQDVAAADAARAKHFGDAWPGSATIIFKALVAPEWLMEIEVMAAAKAWSGGKVERGSGMAASTRRAQKRALSLPDCVLEKASPFRPQRPCHLQAGRCGDREKGGQSATIKSGMRAALFHPTPARKSAR
jgi:hypothetical protein